MTASKKSSDMRQRGFSMIEVLIAVVVLAVGLLGVAGLQTVSMQQTVAADNRSVAIMHAQTMAERVRSARGVPAPAEIDEWKSRITKDLGSGGGGEVAAVGANAATVDVTWTERKSRLDSAGGNETAAKFSLRVRFEE